MTYNVSTWTLNPTMHTYFVSVSHQLDSLWQCTSTPVIKPSSCRSTTWSITFHHS